MIRAREPPFAFAPVRWSHNARRLLVHAPSWACPHTSSKATRAANRPELACLRFALYAPSSASRCIVEACLQDELTAIVSAATVREHRRKSLAQGAAVEAQVVVDEVVATGKPGLFTRGKGYRCAKCVVKRLLRFSIPAKFAPGCVIGQ